MCQPSDPPGRDQPVPSYQEEEENLELVFLYKS